MLSDVVLLNGEALASSRNLKPEYTKIFSKIYKLLESDIESLFKFEITRIYNEQEYFKLFKVMNEMVRVAIDSDMHTSVLNGPIIFVASFLAPIIYSLHNICKKYFSNLNKGTIRILFEILSQVIISTEALLLPIIVVKLPKCSAHFAYVIKSCRALILLVLTSEVLSSNSNLNPLIQICKSINTLQISLSTHMPSALIDLQDSFEIVISLTTALVSR